MQRDVLNEDWRIILPDITDPHQNILLEKRIFISVENGNCPSTFRLWKNKPSAIIGISQKPEDELNIDICTKLNIPIVKRFTGGGTVYHDLGNLNWTYFIRKDERNVPKKFKIHTLYNILSFPIITTLKEAGLDAKLKPPTGIYLFGKKISGFAMRIKRNSILCHGTLLIDSDLIILNKIFKKLKEPVTNINYHTNTKISQMYIIREIIANVKKQFHINFKKISDRTSYL